jgi:secreted trypsin-like serine protease
MIQSLSFCLPIIVIVILGLLVKASVADDDGRKRIKNGYQAVDNQFPFHASLLKQSDPIDFQAYICSAVVIHPMWVLSAAHCCQAPAIDVLLGTTTLSNTTVRTTGIRVAVAQKYLHQFTFEVGLRDLCALKLSQSVGSNHASPIQLATVAPIIYDRNTEAIGNFLFS